MPQEHQMITFDKDNIKFTYRIVGVIIHDGHVLLQHAEQEGFYFLTGGRAELREAASETIKREMREELGIDVQVERLLWVIENFFEFAGTLMHELGLYFLLSVPPDAYILNTTQRIVRTEAGGELVFQWYPIDQLAAAPLYPTFLQEALKELPEATQHIVHRDG